MTENRQPVYSRLVFVVERRAREENMEEGSKVISHVQEKRQSAAALNVRR